MPTNAKHPRTYRGKTKAFRRFRDSLSRTSDLLEASEFGLDEKNKVFGPILDKLGTVKAPPGRRPKNYVPLVKGSRIDEKNVSLELDERSAALIKKAIRFAQVKHKALRFHLYSILTTSLWGAFETYSVMLLEELYHMRPELLKSSELLTQADVIQHRESIVDLVVEKQLEKVGHFVLADLLDYLKKRLGITIPDQTTKQLAEYYLLRNVVAHSTGLPRPTYLRSLPAELSIVGGEVRVTKAYLQTMIARLDKYITAVEKQVVSKFFLASAT